MGIHKVAPRENKIRDLQDEDNEGWLIIILSKLSCGPDADDDRGETSIYAHVEESYQITRVQNYATVPR